MTSQSKLGKAVRDDCKTGNDTKYCTHHNKDQTPHPPNDMGHQQTTATALGRTALEATRKLK